VVLSQFIPQCVFFSAHIIERFSVETFATDCLRSYVRVHLFSYNAFSSLAHWDVDHRELGYLYHCNVSLSSHYLVLKFS
jgi:hypothetical protein